MNQYHLCSLLEHHTLINQNMLHVDPTFLLLNNSNASPLKFQEHREEVDHYIKSQNENFRMLLQEQREQHMMELLKKMESEALYELNQKDEQIAQAAKKKLELEEFMRRLEAENQSWRIVAQKNEAMAMSLHNTLEQIKERVSYGTIVEDAESCYDGNRLVKEESEENKLCNDGVGEAEQITNKTMICKCCNFRSTCFMFLPCRHLCSCQTCEPLLQACPVCRMPKKSSIETLIF